MDYEKVLLDLIKPIVNDRESVSVKQMESLDEEEILLYVYANDDDIARLIGRKGIMDSSLRQMMSVAARDARAHVTIKFEAY